MAEKANIPSRPIRSKKEKILVKCKMCKGLYNIEFMINGKCPECDKIFKEWQNGRPKTPEEKEKFKGIRAHYTIPTYKKVYSVYQYDQEKYSAIWKKIRALAFQYGKHIYYNTSPYRVLELCYIRDEEGNLIHLCDEKHIYRYATLHKLCALVAKTLTNKYGLDMDARTIRYLRLKTGIIYFDDDVEPTAEHEQAIDMCLKDRIRVAIRLYRLLNMDEIEIEKASALAPALHRKLPKDKRKPIDKNKLVASTKVEDAQAEPIERNWEEIKTSYKKGASVKTISSNYDVPITTLFDKVKNEGWDNGIDDFISNELPDLPTKAEVEEREAIARAEVLRPVTLMLSEDEEKAVKVFLDDYRAKKRRA